MRTIISTGETFVQPVSRVTNGGSIEDRTIAHFDITGLSTFTTASLSFGYDEDSGDGAIDFYNFSGDGMVSVDEFDAGSGPFATFTNTVTNGEGVLDITSLLQAAVTADDSFLSFNLRAAGLDGDFSLADTIDGVTGAGIFGTAGPTFITLTGVPAVPLPAGGVLLISAVGCVFVARRRRQAC